MEDHKEKMRKQTAPARAKKARNDFVDYLLTMLRPLSENPLLGLTFYDTGGGVFISCDSEIFAYVHELTLYFRVDQSNLSRYQKAGSKQYGKMSYYEVPQDIIVSDDKLRSWAKASIAVAKSIRRDEERAAADKGRRPLEHSRRSKSSKVQRETS